jgi:putative iron-dependent peroxidase
VNHPQPGIFALGTRSHHHLQFHLTGDANKLLAAVGGLRDAASAMVGVNVVVGFSPRAWAQAGPQHLPDDLVDFEPIVAADGFTIPSGQHDLWIWLHGAGPDSVFNVARQAARHLDGIAALADEQPSFAYQASQDLTGFEDGTENPSLDEALEATTIPTGSACQGGSIALLQRWVHDLDGFEALELADREQVIGRTYYGSSELEPERQPPDSHVSRVVIEDDQGEELQVFRRSTAYGGAAEHGLIFVAFSPDRARLERMLRRMAGLEDGLRDRLTRYSTPTSSAWYLVPPVELL